MAFGEVTKSIFRVIDDPRIQIVSLVELGAGAPDVLVIKGHDPVRARESAAAIPDMLWKQAAACGTVLVLDASGEGYHHLPERSDAFHAFLAEKGVDPARTIHLNQARAYADDYTAYCDARGLGPRRMTVMVYDLFIRTAIAPFHGGKGGEAFGVRLRRQAAASGPRARRFICLNNKMRPLRTLLMLRLLQQGLWRQGFISTGELGHVGRGADARQQAVSQLRSRTIYAALTEDFAPLVEELLPYLDQLIAQGPSTIRFDEPAPYLGRVKGMIAALGMEESGRSWFSVVTETDFGEKLFRITEKPMKPLLDFHPFVVLGCPGALRLIRGYGFETFPALFDERYDEESDPRIRFEMVFGQIDRLCRMDEADLAREFAAVAEAVIFNAWWGLVELPRLFRDRIDAEVIDRVASLRASPSVPQP